MNFYRGLVGTTSIRLRHVDIVALRNGKQLPEEDSQELIRVVTDKEIWEALQGVGDNKAPSGDGYTAKFFKATWNTTRHDVCSAVKDFFRRNESILHSNML